MEDRDEFGRSALHYAALENNPGEAQRLLAAGAAVDARDSDQSTPLIFAAQMGFADIATLLIDHGADVDAVDSSGRSALARAVMAPKNDGSSDAIATIRVLRSRGADPTSKTITSDYFEPISAVDIVRDHMRDAAIAAEFGDLL